MKTKFWKIPSTEEECKLVQDVWLNYSVNNLTEEELTKQFHISKAYIKKAVQWVLENKLMVYDAKMQKESSIESARWRMKEIRIDLSRVREKYGKPNKDENWEIVRDKNGNPILYEYKYNDIMAIVMLQRALRENDELILKLYGLLSNSGVNVINNVNVDAQKESVRKEVASLDLTEERREEMVKILQQVESLVN